MPGLGAFFGSLTDPLLQPETCLPACPSLWKKEHLLLLSREKLLLFQHLSQKCLIVIKKGMSRRGKAKKGRVKHKNTYSQRRNELGFHCSRKAKCSEKVRKRDDRKKGRCSRYHWLTDSLTTDREPVRSLPFPVYIC